MKKFMTWMLAAFMVFGITGCAGNDEPETPGSDGVAVYINAADMLYGDDDNPVFTPTQTPGLYVAQAASLEVSESYIKKLILDENWNGKDITVNLDKNGYLKITGNSPSLTAEGIYNEVSVHFTDFEPFTLRILSEQRASDDNGYGGTGVVRITGNGEVQNFPE